jgi:hypothetical protein
MRVLVILSVLGVSLTFATPVLAQKCPANATEASYSVWGPNSIRTGQTVTGTHRCGRRLRCTGGTTNVRGSRNCSWL